MCGIFCLLNYEGQFPHKAIDEDFQNGKHRGPEYSILKNTMIKTISGFHRLAINGLNPESHQPIIIKDISLICNGEIYNYKELIKLLEIEDELQTDSDCEIIIHLYRKYGMEHTLQLLDGVFSFVLVDFRLVLEKSKIFVARDPYGVRPLFVLSGKKSKTNTNNDPLLINDRSCMFGFASELKSLKNTSKELSTSNKFSYNISQFQPGTFSEYNLSFKVNSSWEQVKKNVKYFDFIMPNPVNNDYETIMKNLQVYFKNAVYKRCVTSDRPIACLLSGGLDSSLVASLVSLYHKENNLPKLETFSIGVKDSEDLINAKLVAEYLDTNHTEIILDEDDFFNNVENVIKDIESYDTTTVRASIGNWLIGKYISNHSKAKVIFNGDGADELMGGYIYFSQAPDCLEFDKECKRLLNNISYFDVLRSDRCISSHGLEPRTPFLDRNFTTYYLSIPPEIRWNKKGERMEKHLIRAAFGDMKYSIFDKQLLPDAVLNRRKEAFSDGVSKNTRSLYLIMREYCYNYFLKNEMTKYPELSVNMENMYEKACLCSEEMEDMKDYIYPTTAEQYYYRKMFEIHYKGYGKIIPYFWMPKYIDAIDSSARTLSIYNKEDGEL